MKIEEKQGARVTKEGWKAKLKSALEKAATSKGPEQIDPLVDCLVEWQSLSAVEKNAAHTATDELLDEIFELFEATIMYPAREKEHMLAVDILSALRAFATYTRDEKLLRKAAIRKKSFYDLVSLLTLDPQKTTMQ